MVLAVWGVVSGWQARSDLLAARDDVRALKTALKKDDDAGAARLVDSLGDHLASAHGWLGQLPWDLAAHLPVVGDDVRALRTTADVGDSVVGEVGSDVVEARQDARGLAVDGGVDLATLQRIDRIVSRTGPVLDRAGRRLAAVDLDGVDGRIAAPIRDLRDQLDEARRGVDDGATALGIVRPMLTGRHAYAVVFQNSAELRSTGGLPGAWTQLIVDDGRVEIGRQGPGNTVISADPVAPVPQDIRAIYQDSVATDFRDTARIPDYPMVAMLQQRLLDRVEGLKVDGVIALDPVAVSYLLRATGPVTLKDGTEVTADNAVEFLLSTVYAKYSDPAQQDAVFAETVRAVFDRVTSGDLDDTALIDGLGNVVDQRRMLVWSAAPATQRRISATSVAGAFPQGEAVGVYLSDDTRAKMNYYLDMSAVSSPVGCSGGRSTYRVGLLLRSTAPADAGEVLPDYVIGTPYGPRGSMVLQVVVAAPRDGEIVSATYAGKDVPFEAGTIEGRPVRVFGIPLNLGATFALELTIEGSPDASSGAAFDVTPTVRFATTQHTIPSACG